MPGKQHRILLVEDDRFVAALSEAFLKEHFEVTVAHSAGQAHAALARSVPDLILLDLGLPDEDGLVLARQLSARPAVPPIIYVTLRDSPQDIVAGLALGGDDYVTKPYDPAVLIARIHAVLRRSAHGCPTSQKCSLGEGSDRIEIDLGRRRVETPSGEDVQLTRAEFDLLQALAGARGRILSRAQLLDAIADSPDHDAGERVIDALVSRIRRKLIAAGLSRAWIETVRGVGYRADCG